MAETNGSRTLKIKTNLNFEDDEIHFEDLILNIQLSDESSTDVRSIKRESSSLSGSREIEPRSHTDPPNSTKIKSRLSEIIEFLHENNRVIEAAENGDHREIERLINSGSPDLYRKDHLGKNALHLAVCSDSAETVKLLLDAGVDPNIKDNLGMTPLSLSLMRRPSVRIAKMLFDYGAILLPRTCTSDFGIFLQFVLMCTPTAEEKLLLQLLLDKGAVINDPEAPGRRQALHLAAMSDNCELIYWLTERGADLFSVNHRNETPKDVAIHFKCRNAQFCLEDIEISGLFHRGSSSKA